MSKIKRAAGILAATARRWGRRGRIASVRTPGGARRFREAEVRALLARPGDPPPEVPGKVA